MFFASRNDRLSVPWAVATFLALFAYAVALRWRILSIVPDPFFMPDSESYLSPALGYLQGQPFQVEATRSLGYPLVLWAVLRFGGSFFCLLLVQHGLTLLIALLSALLYYRHVRPSWGLSAFIFFALSCSPRALFYGHSVLTEVLFTFWQTVALFFVFETQKPILSGGISGLFMACAMATRPMGRALLYGFLCTTGFLTRQVKLLKPTLLMSLTAGILTSAIFIGVNHHIRGFWGFEQKGNAYIFRSTMAYLNLEKIDDPDLRALLRPYYGQEYADRMKDMNWITYSPDGPTEQIIHHPRFGPHAESIFQRLTVQALLNAPGPILRNFFILSAQFVLFGAQLPPHDLMRKEVGTLQGLRLFQQFSESYPQTRLLVRFKPEQATPYFERIKHNDVFPFERGSWFNGPAWAMRHFWSVLPCFALLMIPLLFKSPNERALLGVLLPIILFQIALVAAGGVYVWRYSYPLESLYILLLIAGVGDLMDKIR